MYRKVLNYLRGQVTVEVESAAPERVLNLCAAHGIPFWGLTWLSELRLRAAIDRAELPRLRQVLTQTDAVLTVVRTEGAPEVWRQYRRRYVLLAAVGLLMLMMALGSTHIWAFQVTGNDTVPTETILRSASGRPISTPTGRSPMWWPPGTALSPACRRWTGRHRSWRAAPSRRDRC